jgi:hypothetical protein
MKNLIVVVFCFNFLNVFGQTGSQETIGKFIISNATKNGVNQTELFLKQKAYCVFYTKDNDGLLYMANVWVIDKTQSYGKIYNLTYEETPATSKTNRTERYTFTWQYINSYNPKEGTATVAFYKTYKQQGTVFTLIMVTEDLDTFVFKGYMEGTLNLSNYLK